MDNFKIKFFQVRRHYFLGMKWILQNQKFLLEIEWVKKSGKFYQLFATVLRWSLENLKKKLPRLSFVWREGGGKEEKMSLTNKQTKKKFKK